MITTARSPRVSQAVLRRRRAAVACAALVLVAVVAASSGAAVTARLFDAGAALAAFVGGIALIRELRRPLAPRAVAPAVVATSDRARVASVRRTPGAVFADAA